MPTATIRTIAVTMLMSLLALDASAAAPKNLLGKFPEAKSPFVGSLIVSPWLYVDADGVHPEIHDLFEDETIVDGQMNTSYNAGPPASLSQITEDTGVNVVSSGVPNTIAGFETHKTSRNFENDPEAQIIRTSNDLELARRSGALGILFYIQKPWTIDDGADLGPQIDAWFETGLRIVQLAYSESDNQNRLGEEIYYAGAADQDIDALSDRGLLVADALLERHFLLDVSHVGEASAMDIIDLAKERGRPVLANHANCKAMHFTNRNKTDAEICAIAQTGGVVGVTPIQFMLQPFGVAATMEDVIAHLDHVVTLDCQTDEGAPIDMINHIAIATDSWVDGWDPSANSYVQLFVDDAMNSVKRWKTLATKLYLDHGYSKTDLTKIFGKNLLRVYRQGLPGLRKFDLVDPVQNAQLAGSSVWFDWDPAVAQSVSTARYNLHIYEKQGGSWVRVRRIRNLNRSSSYVHDLPTGRDYRWYVHARNGDGVWVNSSWGYFSN